MIIAEGIWINGVFEPREENLTDFNYALITMRDYTSRFARTVAHFYGVDDFFEKTGLIESLCDASSYAQNILILLEWDGQTITEEVYTAYTTVVGLCVAYFEPDVFEDWAVTLLDISEPADWFSAQFL